MVAKGLPDSSVWRFLALHQTHVEWRGCSLHDMIQPSFSFLVGAALPFSMASRLRRGETFRQSLGHAAWRAFALIALGIWLRSIGKKQTNFTFGRFKANATWLRKGLYAQTMRIDGGDAGRVRLSLRP